MAGPDDWWREAEAELERARKLSATGDDQGAYAHAGQAIEFALKAVYMRKNALAKWPDDKKGANWHNLQLIAEAAGVKPDARTEKEVLANWLTARDWSSNARFPGQKVPRAELRDLMVAVSNEQNGVMGWLRNIFQKL